MADFETQIKESQAQVAEAQAKISAITSRIEEARSKLDQGVSLDVENATLEDVHKHTDLMNANIAELIMGLDDVTAGFSAERHIHVLAQHAPGFQVDDIIIDASRVPSDREREQLARTATLLGANVEFAAVSRPGTQLHDPSMLAAALEGVRLRGREPGPPGAAAEHVQGSTNGPRGDESWR